MCVVHIHYCMASKIQRCAADYDHLLFQLIVLAGYCCLVGLSVKHWCIA